MKSILRHGDSEWDVEFWITTKGTAVKVSSHPKDIKNLLLKHKVFFQTFHMPSHLTMALNTELSWKLVHFQ